MEQKVVIITNSGVLSHDTVEFGVRLPVFGTTLSKCGSTKYSESKKAPTPRNPKWLGASTVWVLCVGGASALAPLRHTKFLTSLKNHQACST
jgi:hypothetical protein